MNNNKRKFGGSLTSDFDDVSDSDLFENAIPCSTPSLSNSTQLDVAMRAHLKTCEDRRQRRFDSLARLICLDSKSSACAAVTLYDGEVIIAANCAKAADAKEVAQLINKKLAVLRSILKAGRTFVKLDDRAAALDYYKNDVIKLQKCGGSFFSNEDLAQALYKLDKSILSPTSELEEQALEQKEIDALLSSAPATILVPAEKTEEDSILEEDWDWQLSDETFCVPVVSTASTPQISSSSWSHGYGKNLGVSVLVTPESSEKTSIKKEAQTGGALTKLVLEQEKLDFSSPVTDRSGSTSVASRSSSNISLAQVSSAASKRACSSLTPGSGKDPKDLHALSGRFWSNLRASSSSESEDEQLDSDAELDSDVASHLEPVKPLDDYLSESFEITCSTQTASSESGLAMAPHRVTYVMNIYINEVIQPFPFPEFIYTNGCGPQSVSDFHADQLIAYYLKEVKKVDLNDATKAVIPFGIIKYCCNACLILCQFNRVQFRGASGYSFRNAVQLFKPSERASTPVNERVLTETSYNSPVIAPKAQKKFVPSPWSK